MDAFAMRIGAEWREEAGRSGACRRRDDYDAGLADEIDGRVVDTGRPEHRGFVTREPLDVVAAVVPWNFAVAAPHAEAGAGPRRWLSHGRDAVGARAGVDHELRRAPRAGGVPPGVVDTVSGWSRDVGERLVGHPDVGHVSFTEQGLSAYLVEKAVWIETTGATHDPFVLR